MFIEGEAYPHTNTFANERLQKCSYSDMFTICFTICLFISPDLDGHRAPKTKALTLRDPENCKVSKPKYEATALCSALFASKYRLPYLYKRAVHTTKRYNGRDRFHDMFHDMFVH